MSTLKTAQERSDIVLVTGGLGPTHDDITKTVACQFFDSETVVDEPILKQVKERFARRGIPMAAVNEEQARVPKKAKLIANDRGTAPGFIFEKGGKRFYVLPGVPFEMKSMMKRVVLPDLQQMLGAVRVETRTLATTGIAESTLYAQLGDLNELQVWARLAFLPSLFGVRIRLTAEADEKHTAAAKLDLAEKRIRELVGEFIYAADDLKLEAVLAEQLVQHNKTLAVAESCTGGLIANRLTDIPGSSRFFERGIVAYSNQTKQQLLGVPESILREYGAVSAPVARAMAEGVRRMAQTDYGLSVTGIAGPGGATEAKPVGLVYVAISDKAGTTVEEHRFTNDRIGNKMRAAQAALNVLRKRLNT